RHYPDYRLDFETFLFTFFYRESKDRESCWLRPKVLALGTTQGYLYSTPFGVENLEEIQNPEGDSILVPTGETRGSFLLPKNLPYIIILPFIGDPKSDFIFS